MIARIAALGLAVTAALGWSGSALAAPSANPNAKVRVHVDTDLFGVSHYNPQNNDADGSNTNVVGFGIGRLSLIDRGSPFGVDRSILSLGVGGVILGGRAVIGARAGFVVDGTFRGNDGSTALGGRLVPYFNYMFNPTGRIRGFLGGRFGFGGGMVTSDGDIDDDDFIRFRTHTIYPIVGAQGGLHIFLVDRVSLDPGASFDYLAPHSRAVLLDPGPAPDLDDSDDFDKNGDAVNFAITLGLSAWF